MSSVFSAGALRVKELLPKGAREEYDKVKHIPLDKGGVGRLMSNIIRNGGDDAGDGISRMSNEFFHHATAQGYSTPLDDYHNDSEDRKTLIQEYKSKVDQINVNKMSPGDKEDALNEVTGKYGKILQDQNLAYMIGKGSTAARMAMTGARGNPVQLQQGSSTPLMSKDIQGTPVPIAITSSFAEGLAPAEQIAMSYWGRGNSVSAQLATSKPGALFKSIVTNMFHEVVTVPDCGTKNGEMVKVSDKRKIVNRYEAGTNQLINEGYYKDLQISGKTSVKVRSVLTCEAKDGVCQRCYGKGANAIVPEIGTNVGVLAAQSASEVLTQMVLSTKHDAKAGKGAKPFDVVNNILVNPGSFKNKAILATVKGRVTDIIKTPLNDSKVFIEGVEHFVPKARKLTVKKGDLVSLGQEISLGIANPRELVSLRGMGEGRRFISSTLRSIYEGEGNDLDTRHFDLMAKNMIKHVEISHSGTTGYIPGQKVNINALAKELKGDSEEVDTSESVGKVLSNGALHLTVGTKLDEGHIQELLSHGVNSVKVSRSGIGITPLVPGLNSVKSLDDNWVSKLTARHLEKTIRDGVAFGHSSTIRSTDPIAAYMMGEDFGTGSDGKY